MTANSTLLRSLAPTPAAGGMAHLAGGALGTWLGLQALRAFLSTVVWNVGEDLPATQMGLIALGVWAVGLLAYLAARWVGGSRPEFRFGLLFGLALLANQLLAHEVGDAVFGFAAVIFWLWWLPAFVAGLARRGAGGLVAPGVLLGLVADVALRTALHGLDLYFLRGPWPVAGALVLVALLAWALAGAGTAPGGAAGGSHPAVGAGALALGPFLFLQMTVLANLGRVQMLSGLDLVPAAGLAVAGLLAALAAVGWAPGSVLLRALLGLAAVALLAMPGWLAGAGAWLLVLVQVGLALALAAALTPTPGRPGRVYAWFVAGALLFFGVLFYYYSRYEWPTLWPVAGALAVLPGLWPRAGAGPQPAARRALAGALVLALVGLGLALPARTGPAPKAGPAPAELTVLNYNIHMGYDYWSVPAIQELAAFIESRDADLVALQEIGRGWNINGGVDLVAYLKWRLPQYHLVYGPMNGELWGNIVLSRYPVKDSGQVRFPVRYDAFQRGLTWATVPTAAGDLVFASIHKTAYDGADQVRDREAQAGDVVDFWARRPRTVIAGDYNARPDARSIQLILKSGLVDLPGARGLGAAFTYSSGQPYERIDYVFASPDVEALSAAIPPTTASDHSPVEVKLRLR